MLQSHAVHRIAPVFVSYRGVARFGKTGGPSHQGTSHRKRLKLNRTVLVAAYLASAYARAERDRGRRQCLPSFTMNRQTWWLGQFSQ